MADPDALRYLRIAQADLEEAQRMLALSGFRDSSIGFRLQQACEKALKGWIHAKGGQAPFTHDLAAWLDWLQESGSKLSAFEAIVDLSCFAVQSRCARSVAIRRQIGILSKARPLAAALPWRAARCCPASPPGSPPGSPQGSTEPWNAPPGPWRRRRSEAIG
jgi:HEPN domain-containing protein